MEYTIFHIDMDSFFASVEEAKNPRYKNKPLVVGGRGRRGVVASANYAARALGIKSAMPIFEAKNIYPSVIVTDACFEDYNYYSFSIYSMLKKLLKYVEIGSIDEWYVSTKDTIYQTWTEQEFAFYLKNSIKQKWGLNCTIGCSWNKFLAKTATNLNKPNGFGLLTKENYQEKIYPLNVSKVYSIGKSTANVLKQYGIKTIKDILTTDKEDILHRLLGVHWITIKQNMMGAGSDIINNSNEPKSIGRSHTIIRYSEFKEFKELLIAITKSLNQSLIEGNFSFNHITMKIRLKNDLIKTINVKDSTDKKWLNENILIYEFDNKIDNQYYDQIKNIGVSLWPIKRNIFNQEQLNMFTDNNNDIDALIVKVNNMLNKKAIYKASELKKHFYKPSR